MTGDEGIEEARESSLEVRMGAGAARAVTPLWWQCLETSAIVLLAPGEQKERVSEEATKWLLAG